MKSSKRQFIKQMSLGLISTQLPFLSNAKGIFFEHLGKKLNLSLAQWSLHNAFESETLDPVLFSEISKKEFGIPAVEYVNTFYKDKGNDEIFWINMKERSDALTVQNLLIMVDEEGDLGGEDNQLRQKAVEDHYKWIHVAKIMGCHSIRVNAFGASDPSIFKASLIDGLSQLANYAAKEEINILIENHGLFSSNAQLISSIIKEINLPNIGTLPDFGNWCLSAQWGSTQDGSCLEMYDPYLGVETLLPYAQGVSAKAYNFHANGVHRNFDYEKMLLLVKAQNFNGHIGIEYEGTELSEADGIRATKKHLEDVWEKIWMI
ncbi:MAG: xylose isomerase [Flammeovirgaceae bacterium TMED32]|nr:MAG: xylose isomerase [Flammeovirgaceae bacterium TMED32]|tara:strand:- start:1125 stop:2081 length:957 start_codon:yes stop_codon:yes gene_type:complete